MHDQRSPDVGEEERHDDRRVLALLLEPDNQRPWSTDELLREIGDRVVMADSLARLFAAGLIHRCGEFVFATRPAVRGAALSG
jgi:predicted transcriptional regulator